MAPRDHFRAHGRIAVQINAVLRQDDSFVIPVTVRDLGFGGAGVDLADPKLHPAPRASFTFSDLATDVPVVLEVVTPVLWDPLYLQGRIVWTAGNVAEDRPARAGIRFDDLGATTLLSLFEVLSSK
jgi:PilZ domain